MLNVSCGLLMAAFPHVDRYFFFADYDFIFGPGGGPGSEVEVRKRIKIEVNLFEGLQYVLFELIVFILPQSEVILKLSLIKLS